MRCPFLREEQVKSCQAAPFRNLVVRAETRPELERCSSPAHAGCPVAPESREAHPTLAHCPFLHESLVQFCGTSPLPTYVPWSDAPEMRCAHSGHRYCELFRAAAPGGEASDGSTHVVDGVPMPDRLLYAPNHLWLDPGDDSVCHIGIDAFLAQRLAPVERLTFLTVSGSVRPAAALTARGVDHTLVFPLPLVLIAANLRLRSRLDRLTSDPYGLGWLFEARWRIGGSRRMPRPQTTLREGEDARGWMADEVRDASKPLHAAGGLPLEDLRPL